MGDFHRTVVRGATRSGRSRIGGALIAVTGQEYVPNKPAERIAVLLSDLYQPKSARPAVAGAPPYWLSGREPSPVRRQAKS